MSKMCAAMFRLLVCRFPWLHQRCSFGKAGIADETLFALADNGCDGCGDDTFVQQDSGQVGQILSKDSVLQGNAGSGNNDRQFHLFWTIHLPKDTAHEVSQRFCRCLRLLRTGKFPYYIRYLKLHGKARFVPRAPPYRAGAKMSRKIFSAIRWDSA